MQKKTEKMQKISKKIADNMKKNIQRRKNFEKNLQENQGSVNKSSSLKKKKVDN